LNRRGRLALEEGTEHLGDEHEVVVLHPDEGVVRPDLVADRFGEVHVALAVGVPCELVKHNFRGVCVRSGLLPLLVSRRTVMKERPEDGV
jgi:hypothetical protein